MISFVLLALLPYIAYRLYGRSAEYAVLEKQQTELVRELERLRCMTKIAIEHTDWRRDSSTPFMLAHLEFVAEEYQRKLRVHNAMVRTFSNPITWLLSRRIQ